MALRGRKRIGDAIVKKADLKLGYVAEVWLKALGSTCSLGSVGFLERELIFNSISELEWLQLSYKIKNKIFATLFDLVYYFEVEGNVAEGSVSLRKDALGFDGFGSGSVAASLLSDSLVLERVQALGITSFNAVYNTDSKRWCVTIQSLVGSSTWNLIPPVLQLIEPSEKECILSAELIRMVQGALTAVKYGE